MKNPGSRHNQSASRDTLQDECFLHLCPEPGKADGALLKAGDNKEAGATGATVAGAPLQDKRNTFSGLKKKGFLPQ